MLVQNDGTITHLVDTGTAAAARGIGVNCASKCARAAVPGCAIEEAKDAGTCAGYKHGLVSPEWTGKVAAAVTYHACRSSQSGQIGIVDNAETREIVALLAQSVGGINLHEAHERLRALLGPGVDGDAWGSLLDAVHAAPGETPLMTVEQAFLAHGQTSGEAADHTVNMESYYRHLCKDSRLL